MGSVLNLTRDYNGAYNSKIRLDKDLTIDGRGHTIDCLEEGGCIAFYSTMGTVFKLSENKNVVAVYSSKAAYKVLVTRNGKAVGAGERVTITYNGKAYEVQTDKNGYATLNLNTKVKVNKYTITAEYKGEKVTNDVIIFRVHNNFTNNCLGFEIRCDFRYRCR